jgi:hypothetical protein
MPPPNRAVCQPQQEEMPSQGLKPGNKTSYHPGLSPAEGQIFNPITQYRSRD